MKEIKYNTEKALDMLLFSIYESEFIKDDGYMVHPNYNYWEWLYRKGIISKEDNEIKQSEIQEVEFED
ncbi:hypothetical protein JGH11_18790 [Dysgonomonas sp. Marseille-P4677]|uniref:hypothetical protein n=1 Tax=Dysgonomonas sp. Marseille-P4677 TaxID=2364790 RepID=UPI0019141242|nr:hypothetical protein [Dysgonomonas sp. Marseille-P4677]MBK5722920.1 hypothetical protein [Dysgonomonas sp. Marseille-P4677]